MALRLRTDRRANGFGAERSLDLFASLDLDLFLPPLGQRLVRWANENGKFLRHNSNHSKAVRSLQVTFL